MSGEEVLHPSQFRYLLRSTGVMTLRTGHKGTDNVVAELAHQTDPTTMLVDYEGRNLSNPPPPSLQTELDKH